MWTANYWVTDTSLVFEYTTLLILSIPVLIKSFFTIKALCVKGLSSEQGVVIGVIILLLAQMLESVNYLMFTDSMVIMSNLIYYKIFLLARIVFTSLVCWLLLLNFDSYKSIRRTRPKSKRL